MALAPLDRLERSAGLALGPRRSVSDVHGARGAPAPLAALEALLRPALESRPCLVAFSGGRDSSAVLATAVALARREGLPDPVPITFRYGRLPRTDETGWQEDLVKRLGLRDWEVLDFDAEADAVGADARAVLERHGPYWPLGAHVIRRLLAAAAGGALITGAGGDELLSAWEHRRLALLRARRTAPARADVRPVFSALLPGRARRAIWSRRRPTPALPWLTPEGDARLRRRLAADRDAYLRRTWAEGGEVYLASRYWELTRATFDTLAADAGARLVEPFYAPEVVRAVLRAGPAAGHATREEALRSVFGGLLPEPVLRRTSKAVFTEAFWGPETRAFAESWTGAGVDDRLVDADALRAEWRRPRPHFASIAPLHGAWLAARKKRPIPAVRSSEPT